MPIVQPTPEAIERAAATLALGQLVVFPTETVYGLGADARNDDAVRAVFARKGRPSNNPLIVHVADQAMARRVAGEWTERASTLAGAFWPGPLTLVVPASHEVGPAVTAGGNTVALRCPDHPVAQALLRRFGGPLVAPSANPSGYVSPSRAEHAAEHFEDLMVLDGGPCRVGIESTVLRVEPLELLRPGSISLEAIAEVAGHPVGSAAKHAAGVEASPGRIGPHYRPRKPTVVANDPETLGKMIDDHGRSWIVIAPAGHLPPVRAQIESIDMPEDPSAYAAGFYAALRNADSTDADAILVLLPGCWASQFDPLWSAIRERLARAATQG